MTATKFLSKESEKIYLAKHGIPQQAQEARQRKVQINATIGMVYDDKRRIYFLRSLHSAHINQEPEDIYPYSPPGGNPELKELWLEKKIQENPSLNPENITPYLPTVGITDTLRITKDLLMNPGEVIIAPDLIWGNYKRIFRNNKIVTFPFYDNGGFNTSGLEETISELGARRIHILLPFPSNPTGYQLKHEEKDEVLNIIRTHADEKQITVILDEAYIDFVYAEDAFKGSMYPELSSLHDNVLAVNADGITKGHCAWGERLGMLSFGSKSMTPEDIALYENKMAGLVRSTYSCHSTSLQNRVITMLKDPSLEKERQDLYALMKKRYDKVRSVLEKNPKLGNFCRFQPFNAGYFLLGELTSKANGNAEEIRQTLLDKSVGVISIGEKYIRIAYSSVPTNKINKLFSRLYKVCAGK